MIFKKPLLSGLFVIFFALTSSTGVYAQKVRPRLASEKPESANEVKKTVLQYERNISFDETLIKNSAPQSAVKSTVISRPAGGPRSVLTNELFVRPTVSTVAANAKTAKSAVSAASAAMAAFRGRLLTSMNSKLGVPYRYGSQGPHTYDCSGLVWTVFGEAGIAFERSSASSFWHRFEPASDEDKYKFGTLVFFNALGHVGIVIDENTFFHASITKGVTFSNFKGYWEKRVIGYRRVPLDQLLKVLQ